MRLLQMPLIGLLLLTSTAAIANAQGSYPKDVVAQYIEDCTAGRGDQALAICTCIIKGLQAKYTFQEFKALNSQIVKTGKAPVGLSNIIKKCKANPTAF